MGFAFPFTTFDVGICNYLMVAPSQLHPSSWAYVNAYQYWCEYLKGKPLATLFFHLFYYHLDTLAQPNLWELVPLVPTIWIFEDFPYFSPITFRFFLVTFLHLLAHTTIFRIEPGVEGKCKTLFPYCWSAKHFHLEIDT